LADRFSSRVQSELLNRHSDYIASGNADRQTASRLFFERLGMLALLGTVERHTIISAACKQLLRVHNGWDNFYNEPPFAERLLLVSGQVPVPDSAKAEFVEAVATCDSGNPYGVSRAAMPTYEALVHRFSPREVGIMLSLPTGDSQLARRIRAYPDVKKRFAHLVHLVDTESVPIAQRRLYESWLK
jgi:hypothetical protein